MAFLLNDALNSLPPHWLVHAIVLPHIFTFLLSHPPLALAVCHHRLVLHGMAPSLQWTSKGVYNQVLSHHAFWRLLHGHSHVHVFELDSGYCQWPTASWEDYLQYDYCGARWGNWEDTCWPTVGNYTRNCVGNSGFSLWRQPMMEHLTRDLTLPPDALIDSYWTEQMRRHWPGYRPCPYDEADRFSTETSYVPKHPEDVPLGWHKPYLTEKWRTEEQVARFKNACPHWQIINDHSEAINDLQPWPVQKKLKAG